MGAVGGVAILGGNFEAPTFPEDKVVQRSLTAGTQESSAIDAVILDALPLGAPGQLDSHAFLWKGHSHNGSPHTIDWKAFVNVTADDGTGSIWTLQTRIDGAPYTDILTVDDNGLLTVSGATLTMDQLIIDADNTEAVLIRKDGDAGDIFIVDTINETVVVSGTDQTGFPPDTRTVLIDTAARKVTIFGTQGGFLLEGRTANVGFAPQASFTNDTGGLDRGTSIELGITSFPMAAIGGAMGVSTAEGYLRLDSRIGGVLSEKVRIAPDGSTIHGLQLLSPIDAVVLDAVDLTGDGQQDSHSILWTGKGFETATPHDIDWKAFVDVTADDGTGSIWTLQTRIDAAGFLTVFQIDDAGNLTIPGSFTVDGLIIDVDSVEAFLVRKNGDGGDVFTIDTVNEVVMLSSAASLNWSTDLKLFRDGPWELALRDGTNDNFFYIYGTFTDSSNYERLALYAGSSSTFFIEAQTAGTGVDTINLNIMAKSAISIFPNNRDFPTRRLILSTTQLTFQTDGTLSIGASTSGRPTIAHLATSVNIGLTKTVPDDAIILEMANRFSDGQTDSQSILWTGKSRASSINHDIDWKAFVDVTANDGTGSIFTIQSRIDAVAFVDEFTITSTTSPTLVNVGPGSTGGAIAFGPIPAQSGTIRLANVDTIIVRDSTNVQDLNFLSFDVSNQIVIGDDAIPRITFKDMSAVFEARVSIMTAAPTSTVALTVGPAADLNVDTVNNLVKVGTALAFGNSPALTGTIRLQNLDTIVIRNAANTGDHFILESLVSDEYNMFDPLIGRVDHLPANNRFFKRVSVHVDGTSTTAFQVDPQIFIVDTVNSLIRLAQNDAVLTWGTASDAQMHRGDAADIIEQRRGLNPQEWRLYDRFVSHADYDRLAVYIGGGPPVKTIEFVAETTNATQGINIEIESFANAFGDGSLLLRAGTSGATFQLFPAGAGAFARYTGPGEFQLLADADLRIGGRIVNLGVGDSTPQIGINMNIAGQGAAAFADSHSFDMIGAGQNANRATWRTFVDVIDINANSIWTLQNDRNGGGFGTNLTINNDGDFNLFGKVKIAVDDAEALFVQKAGGGGPGQDIFKIDTSASGFPPGNMVRLTGALFRQEISVAGNTFGTTGGLDYVHLRIAPSQIISGGASDEAHILLVEGNVQGFSGDIARINVATFTGSVTTQNVAEAVASISQVQIDEPTINLQGSSTVTEAQSLLITGAPTEGVRNYALNILGGDLAVDDSSAILFNFGSSDQPALSIAPTGRLEMGLSGTPWARITFYSPIVTAVGILRAEATATDHSGRTDIQSTFADVATSAGSSVFAAGLIPAGSFLIGVTVRVLTTVTGPTGFDVGDGTDVDRWGNSIAVAAGTTTDITDFSSGAVTTFPFANDVRLTSDGVDFTGGSVRITVHYMTLETSAA